jgi:hypothetical protein
MLKKILTSGAAALGLLCLAGTSYATDPAMMTGVPGSLPSYVARTIPSGHPVVDSGRVHGFATGDALRVTRLHPMVQLNPIANSASHPFTASQIAATLATYRQGSALRDFMTGNQAGGTTNLGLARYNTGRAIGITQ